MSQPMTPDEMFSDHTAWADAPCHYVVAYSRTRRAFLAGPYPSREEADRALASAREWAVRSSGDPAALGYLYHVHHSPDGRTRSILGEWGRQAGGPKPDASVSEGA
jgi:hypothetical protein